MGNWSGLSQSRSQFDLDNCRYAPSARRCDSVLRVVDAAPPPTARRCDRSYRSIAERACHRCPYQATISRRRPGIGRMTGLPSESGLCRPIHLEGTNSGHRGNGLWITALPGGKSRLGWKTKRGRLNCDPSSQVRQSCRGNWPARELIRCGQSLFFSIW
jgi:hypothetical protein